MRRVFLDIGGNVGQSIEKFSKEYVDFDFYSFEPNVKLIPRIYEVIRSLGRPVFVFPGAAWTHDGHIEFFLGHSQGSTTMPGKVERWPGVPQIDYTKPIAVPCIDLSAFLARNFTKEDRVIMKMDIEGGEFEVVPKMLQDGTLGLLEKFYCEWHSDRFPEIGYARQAQLEKECRKHTSLETWL